MMNLEAIVGLFGKEKRYRIIILLAILGLAGAHFSSETISKSISQSSLPGILNEYKSLVIPGMYIVLPMIMTILGIIIIWLERRFISKEHSEGVKSKIRELNKEIEGLKNKEASDIKKHREETEALKEKLENPPIAVVTKRQYGQILKEWNDAGKGNVLLYNIELQSFSPTEITKTWSGISHLENIHEVVLLLPDLKVRRWERTVLSQENKFFEKSKGTRKFSVCEVPKSKLNEEDDRKPTNIAFGLYRFGDDASQGSIHKKVVVFVLSQPFCLLKEPLVEEVDVAWWDYHHVLRFSSDDAIITSLLNIWTQNLDTTRLRNVDRVIEDCMPLKPIAPGKLFEKLSVSSSRQTELLAHFNEREVIAYNPDPISQNDESRDFVIIYDNKEKIEGDYHSYNGNVNGNRQGLVWVGGFTEKENTKLPRLFERVLKNENTVQFFYKVSPSPEYITLSRYQQDMEEVLKYANSQSDIVQQNKLILIARSINAFIAAMVASKDEFIGIFSSVILVAPVFDVIEMIDKYRDKSTKQGVGVAVEKCWRCKPGYNVGSRWEDEEYGWLEFFKQNVSLTLLADIIKHEKETFTMAAFKKAIGAISQKCPICILSHPDDPITGSRKALKMLNDAASGTGYIRTDNFKYIEINSKHLPPDQIDTDVYPFPSSPIKDELGKVRDIFRNMLNK
ncbi:MAG: hypothetical protein ACE5GV_00475 [Candidatus Scalindua sp.]